MFEAMELKYVIWERYGWSDTHSSCLTIFLFPENPKQVGRMYGNFHHDGRQRQSDGRGYNYNNNSQC